MAGNGFTLGGDPMAIAASGVQWQMFAAQACDAASDLRGAAAASYGFDGDEGDALRTRIATDAAIGLDLVAQAWRTVGSALIRYATQLDSCQSQLRGLAATATAQQSQMTSLSSAAASGAPMAVIELQQTLGRTVSRADAVRVEHNCALSDCSRTIDIAAALAPVPPPGVRGLLEASFSGARASSAGGMNVVRPVGSTHPLSSTAGLLRIAATSSTRLPAFGLRGPRAGFTAPDDNGGPPPVQGTTAELETRLYESCFADLRAARSRTDPAPSLTDALDDENACHSLVQSALSDPQAMVHALELYPWADGVRPPQPQGWDAFAEGVGDFVDAVAVVIGVDDCPDGDAGGCAAQAGLFMLGPLGKGLEKAARALKFGHGAEEAREVAARAAHAADHMPPPVVEESEVRRRLEQWPEGVAPGAADLAPIPDEWLTVVSERIPEGWTAPIRGKPSKDSRGRASIRLTGAHPRADNVRIDRGNPASPQASQRVDHVVVTSNGQVITRTGGVAPERGGQYGEVTHIPLDEWRQWTSWDHP